MGNLAIAAFGTQLLRGDGATPEQFTAIAEITNISGPRYSMDTEDATSHDSEDGFEDVVGTILRSGEVTLDLNFVPGNAGHIGLMEDYEGKVKRNFRLVFPDEEETTWEFAALVTQPPSPEAPVGGILTASVTLKPTGKVKRLPSNGG